MYMLLVSRIRFEIHVSSILHQYMYPKISSSVIYLKLLGIAFEKRKQNMYSSRYETNQGPSHDLVTVTAMVPDPSPHSYAFVFS